MWPIIHHDILGHVPNPGFRGIGSANSTVTIDPDGLRFSGEPPASNDQPMLAVGDSYTYGEEVSDLETWPAQLQRLTGRCVLNGGVSGYGFDQIVLRAEQLCAVHRPSILLASFIADDVARTEMSRLWWRDKPWFAIEADQLLLKGVPVPERRRLPIHVRHRLERTLIGFPPFVQHLFGYHARMHASGLGLTIVRRLVERLAGLQTTSLVRIVLMAQYHPMVWTDRAFAAEQTRVTQAVLGYATANRMAVLDTFSRLATEANPRGFYGSSHMNARGNLAIASLLSARLPLLVSS